MKYARGPEPAVSSNNVVGVVNDTVPLSEPSLKSATMFSTSAGALSSAFAAATYEPTNSSPLANE